MAEFDMQTWPLVLVEVSEAPGEQETWAPWGALAAAVDRGGPFALVIAMPPVIPRPSQPTDRMKWLKSSRPIFAERCRGVAYAMSSPEGMSHAEHWIDGARKAYGCPVEAFADRDRAIAWARAQLFVPAGEAGT